MILLVDNYDSFSYNLYQLVGQINPDIRVIRNDEMSVEEIRALKPSHIILSPGPGRPENAGILIELIQTLKGEIPILGVCLGHQAICAALGANVTYAQKLMHGKQSEVELDGRSPLFKGCPSKSLVARYHSLAVQSSSLPPCLHITAQTSDGEIMAIEHQSDPLYGVQFHPESIMTSDGLTMLQNFLSISTE